MKNFILIFSFCALVAVAIGAYLLLHTPSITPQLLDDQDKIVTLPTNSKIYLHFWGSWCGPCVQELPELDKYAGRHPDIAIYPIHVSRNANSKEEAQLVYEKLNIKNLKVYHDPGHVLTTHFRIQNFPSTLEISSDFQEIKRLSGAQQWQYYD